MAANEYRHLYSAPADRMVATIEDVASRSVAR